jgi:hypothetical protein
MVESIEQWRGLELGEEATMENNGNQAVSQQISG